MKDIICFLAFCSIQNKIPEYKLYVLYFSDPIFKTIVILYFQNIRTVFITI